MLRPRSRLGLFLRIAIAVVLIGLVSVAVIWTSGRVRLNRALEELRASGGPELPPQEPEVTEGGKKTAAWFAQFGDENEWARDELDSTRAIESHLAAHGEDRAVVAQSESLKVLADALRVSEEEISAHQAELEHDSTRKQLAELLERTPLEAREDLEQDRVDRVKARVRTLLESQEPLERWDRVSLAWVSSRSLAHANALGRVSEVIHLSQLDPPMARGVGRFEVEASRAVFALERALMEALPAHALHRDVQGFDQTAQAALALGRMHSRCWGFIHYTCDGVNTQFAEDTLRACLYLLPPSADLSSIEDAVASLRPRERGLVALRQERAIGNEVFHDLRAGFLDAPRDWSGKGLVENQLVRLWWDHEQAGYLEDAQRALELSPRAPFECSGGLAAYDSIGADLRGAHWWKMIRSMITPNFRSQARMTAVFEVQQQLTLLCLAASRDPASVTVRLSASKDPFTGKPLKMRDEGGVLVFWSVGEDLHDDEPGSEHGDDIVARIRLR